MPAYALTVFLGAFLLFQVQPLMGKYLLPWFGGGTGVWATCLFFFQAVLLGGYAYAHVLTRNFRLRNQCVIHILMLVAALVCLPIVPSRTWKPHPGERPWAGILLVLACNVGLPYGLLASTGPLLQRWWSELGSNAPPYRLYALSNVGSLLALVSYPVFFEVHFSRRVQSTLWGWGLVGYALCCGFCVLKTWKFRREDCAGRLKRGRIKVAKEGERLNAPVSVAQRVLWMLWPACASVLLLATTNKLCLDVAAVPFLWILPLSLYLLSFVVCFNNQGWYSPVPYALAAVVALTCLSWALFKGTGWPFWRQAGVYAGTLFVCSLICHGELFRLRPDSQALTEFYFLIALGGALGGLFVSLIAPAIFTSYCELNWGLALFGLLVSSTRTFEKRKISFPFETRSERLPQSRLPSLAWSDLDRQRLVLIVSWLGFFCLAATLWLQARRVNPEIIHRARNFYGVLTVFEHRKDQPMGHHFLLQHGRITHGLQFADPQLQSWPTTYYGADSGVGLALNALPPGPPRRLGVIGLGTGTIAAYARPGDYFRFYEINPEVCSLAASRFTYLNGCRGAWDVIPGDARLSLEEQVPQGFDLLALDAFNSDAIPVHLLTQEAFELYKAHLKTNGILAIHVSNHFLDLEPVLFRLAQRFGLKAAVIDHDARPEQWWIYSSTWVLLTRDEQVLKSPAIRSVARPLRASKETSLWTDDFCSLFQILK